MGIGAGYWTPGAARQATFVLAHLPPREAEGLLGELELMTPSRSVLDRLPRAVSTRWEAHRAAWEAAVQAQATVPDAAVSAALSVDGVLVPMKAKAPDRTAQQAEAGKPGSGPAGYQEAGCGTVSLSDADGERLQTVRFGRMPASRKVTLQAQVPGEAQALAATQPDLRWVLLADGAEPNWKLLATIALALGLAPGAWHEIVDF